jgi:hypothetical protein
VLDSLLTPAPNVYAVTALQVYLCLVVIRSTATKCTRSVLGVLVALLYVYSNTVLRDVNSVVAKFMVVLPLVSSNTVY